MNFWFIAIPIVFGVLVAASIVACLCCRCTPQKAEDEEPRGPQVLRVVLYPDDNDSNSNVNAPDGNSNHNDANHHHRQNASTEARNGVPHAHSASSAAAAANARRRLEYRYYPLQAGEQRPITAAVAGSTPEGGEAPYVGTVVTDAGNSVPGGDFSRVREPVNYGEAVYVSRSESSVAPAAKSLGNASE